MVKTTVDDVDWMAVGSWQSGSGAGAVVAVDERRR
jgi:hypothetical protein